eukprot:COSAG01_NODE_9218_length_2515_cov_1.421358_3_plen_200_part_01
MPPKRKNAVKKAKRNAYKKKPKAIMKAKRKPFVECKTRSMLQIATRNRNKDGTSSENYFNPCVERPVSASGVATPGSLLPQHTGAFCHLPLTCFTRMSQGVRSDQMTGDNLFSRSLVLRSEFEFPKSGDQIIYPYSVYLVCGWVTNPTAFTSQTAIKQTEATMLDVRDHIEEQVKEFFNQKLDQLTFEKSVNRNIKIDKY